MPELKSEESAVGRGVRGLNRAGARRDRSVPHMYNCWRWWKLVQAAITTEQLCTCLTRLRVSQTLLRSISSTSDPPWAAQLNWPHQKVRRNRRARWSIDVCCRCHPMLTPWMGRTAVYQPSRTNQREPAVTHTVSRRQTLSSSFVL